MLRARREACLRLFTRNKRSTLSVRPRPDAVFVVARVSLTTPSQRRNHNPPLFAARFEGGACPVGASRGAQRSTGVTVHCSAEASRDRAGSVKCDAAECDEGRGDRIYSIYRNMQAGNRNSEVVKRSNVDSERRSTALGRVSRALHPVSKRAPSNATLSRSRISLALSSRNVLTEVRTRRLLTPLLHCKS